MLPEDRAETGESLLRPVTPRWRYILYLITVLLALVPWVDGEPYPLSSKVWNVVLAAAIVLITEVGERRIAAGKVRFDPDAYEGWNRRWKPRSRYALYACLALLPIAAWAYAQPHSYTSLASNLLMVMFVVIIGETGARRRWPEE